MTDTETTVPAQPPFSPPRPSYGAAFTGFTDAPDGGWGGEDWPNCVMVDVAEGYARTNLGDDAQYADVGEVRMLVKIDTNYKASRGGEHPVSLTRGDAVAFAAAVLRAVYGTFDGRTTGTLRATEATDLLAALGSIDAELVELREQALADLRAGLDELLDPDELPDEPDATEAER